MMMRWIAIPLTLLAIGCSNQLAMSPEEARVVRPADFVGDLQVVLDPVLVSQEETDVQPTADGASTQEVVVQSSPLPLEEEDDSLMPIVVGTQLTVEALIGQVNGRPVYANRVLRPIANQLQAAARTMSRSAFSQEIRAALYFESETMGTLLRGGEMYELVITDLLLTEARSSMSPEQEFGLISVIKQFQQDLISGEGGSESKMRTSIQEQSGKSVEDFIEFQRDKILIDALFRQQIWPRVSVTWRDIVREFEQVSFGETELDAEIDPVRLNAILSKLKRAIPLSDIPEAHGSVTLGMIRLPKEDPRVNVVIDQFAAGRSFSEVATLVDMPDDGVWETFKMGIGGIGEIEVADIIKNQLVGAVKGEILSPFELGSSKVWLSILNVQQPISIYNRKIQIELQNVLRWVQFNREKNRFVDSLWGKGSLDEVRAMADRIANIAVRRYQQ